MTYLRALLVLLSWVTAPIATGFALFSGPAHLALGFGGVAVVSALAAWGLTLKAEADMERYRAGREEIWARRFAQYRAMDAADCEQEFSDELLLQLPERFDAG